MKRSAGVILVCEIEGKQYALLSKRPYWNSETSEAESWAGGYQVTAAGKMEETDKGDFRQCALRELGEETSIGFLPNQPEEVFRDFSDEKEVITFMSTIPFADAILAMQKVHLVPVTLEMAKGMKGMRDYRADGSFSEKHIPFKPEDGMRMFPDEKQAVVKALSMLSVKV